MRPMDACTCICIFYDYIIPSCIIMVIFSVNVPIALHMTLIGLVPVELQTP